MYSEVRAMYLDILVSEEETKGLWTLNVSQDSYLYFIFTLECIF